MGSLGGAFPTLNPVVSDVKRSGAGFLVELDPAGQPLKSSVFGGHLTQEVPTGVAADAAGNIYLAGSTSPQNENPQPDPILVGPSIRSGLTGGNAGLFFAKINPANAPQLSVNTAIPPFLFLRNAGTADLHISNITFSGGRTWGNCGAIVPAGTSCIVTVSTTSGGLASGTLTISSDATPAVQTFNVVLLPGQIAGSPIGDFVWADDDNVFLPLRLQQTVPFKLWNVGTSGSVINQITASPGSSQTNDCGAELAPGASCTINVTLSLNGSLVTLFFDNGAQKTFDFFSRPVTQDPVLSIAGIIFPTQFVGGVSFPRTITVTNTGDSDIVVPQPLVTGDPEFTIAGNTCPIPLAAHQSCVVGVQFTPAIDGNRSAIVGIGSSTVQLFAGGAIRSQVQVAPLEQDFSPTVIHLGNQILTISLTNTLGTSLPITGITFSLGDYTETDDCAGQVPANGSCTVQVKFVPQAVGARNGTMTVSFTGATTQVLTLTGTGQTPFLINPHVLNFSAAVGNTSPEQGISIGNFLPSPEGYTFTVTGDFMIAQNPCVNPLTADGQPGSGCAPTIAFQPKTSGNKQGTFTVSYAGISEQDVVTLNGAVTAVTVSPLQLNFPVTKITTSATLDVTMTNSAGIPVGITSLSISGPYSETDACGGTVPSNGSCVIHVKFTPQTATFPETGLLNVALADGGQYSVALSGIGTGPVVSIVPISGTTFPDQVAGTVSNNGLTVSIANNGDAPLNISGIAIDGNFSESNNCPPSLVSSCQITLNFAPKGTGLQTGVLTVTDDGLGSPQTLSFTGNGTDFVFSAGAAASVRITAGQSATYNLALSAVGSFSGQIQFDCSGAPPLGNCQLSTPNVNVIGSVPVPVTVTITTSPHTTATGASIRLYLASLNWLAGLAILPFILLSRRLRKSTAKIAMMLAISAAVVLTASCGGGSQTPPQPPPAQGGTPAGTYTITVTATDQTINGPVAHHTNLTLTVQ